MILARYYIPFLNVAFVFTLIITILMTLAIYWYAKKRPVGQKTTWGEAMAGSAYAFFVMFMAYGVVPHQFLTHAGNELGWRKDKLLFGPGGVLKPKSMGGQFPFQISYEAIQDIIATVIYVIFLAWQILLWVQWQNRGKAKAGKAIATSSFGRPLVKKA